MTDLLPQVHQLITTLALLNSAAALIVPTVLLSLQHTHLYSAFVLISMFYHACYFFTGAPAKIATMREYEVLRAKWAKKSKRKKLVTAKPIAPDHWITPFILKRFCAVAFVGALCTSHSGKGFVLVDGSKNNLVYFYGIYDHLIGFRKLMFGRVRQNEIFYLFMAVSRNVSCMFSYSGDLTSDTSSLAAGAYDLFSLGDTKDMLQATNCITASAYHLKQGFAAEQQSLVAMLYRSFETGMHNPTQDEIMIVYYSIHFGNHLLVWMLPMFFMTWYLEINREGFFTKSPAYIDYIALAFTKSYPFHKLARNVVLIMLSGVPEDMQYVEWSATPAHGGETSRLGCVVLLDNPLCWLVFFVIYNVYSRKTQ